MPRSPQATPSGADDGNMKHSASMKKVAFLYVEAIPQKQIAHLLSLSPSMVSRLIERARETKLLKESVECDLSEKEMNELREEIFQREALLKKLRDFALHNGVASVSQVQIIPTGLEINTDLSWDHAAVTFGDKAAPHCLELIAECETLGVTYGRTLASLASGLQKLSGQVFRKKQSVVCVPLWGEPLSPWEKPRSTIFREPAKLSSSGLAAALHRILNEPGDRPRKSPSKEQPHSLDFVPAFRPENFPKEKFDMVIEFACSVSSYGDIFPVPEDWLVPRKNDKKPKTAGRQPRSPEESLVAKRPLVDYLDGILTSVGTKDQPGRFWSGEFFRQGDIDLPRLRRGALGDLGGTFVVNPGAERKHRDYVTAVNDRWTGVKHAHYKRCALRARENDLPGVIVLAVGAVRAEIVRECVKLGLVNHLLLDSDCAQQVSRLL